MSAWRRITLMVGALLVFIAIPAMAQDQGGSGLSISPTRTELSIEPGQTGKVNISLKNVSGTDVVARVTVNDFESDNETGEPKLLADNSKPTAASIRNFLSGLTDVELKNDEKKDIELGLQVPTNAVPGAYYGVIRYTAVPVNRAADPGQVALTASVGTLVLIEVPGNITEQIQIRSLRVLQDDKSGSFFFKSPNKIAIEVKNTGNSFSKPFGKVNVTKSGGKEVFSYELNNTDPKSNILPASSRTFTNAVENVKTPGRYTVTANISHGRGGEVITQRFSFWYVPTWLLVALLAGLMLVVAGAFVLYRKRFSGRASKRRR